MCYLIYVIKDREVINYTSGCTHKCTKQLITALFGTPMTQVLGPVFHSNVTPLLF